MIVLFYCFIINVPKFVWLYWRRQGSVVKQGTSRPSCRPFQKANPSTGSTITVCDETWRRALPHCNWCMLLCTKRRSPNKPHNHIRQPRSACTWNELWCDRFIALLRESLSHLSVRHLLRVIAIRSVPLIVNVRGVKVLAHANLNDICQCEVNAFYHVAQLLVVKQYSPITEFFPEPTFQYILNGQSIC